jgi:hypothetical protein
LTLGKGIIDRGTWLELVLLWGRLHRVWLLKRVLEAAVGVGVHLEIGVGMYGKGSENEILENGIENGRERGRESERGIVEFHEKSM